MPNPFPLYELAQKAYNTPLLILPDKGSIIGDILYRNIVAKSGGGGDDERAVEDIQLFPPVKNADGSVHAFSPRTSRFVGETPIDVATGRPLPYRVTPDGIGLITIVGTLVNRGAWIGASSGMVSYEGIKHQAAMIAKNSAVKKVILDIQSPGGEAGGAFDCAEAIRKLAAVKPVTAFVNAYAASGGYALASACTRIVCIPEGKVGSIGVYTMLCDFSAALAMEGIKVRFIYAGEHKVEGNPYEELKPEVAARIQKDIETTYTMFCDTVGAGRGSRFSAADARATGALMFSAADAKALGMIDSIGTFEDLLVEMAQPDSMTMMMPSDGGDDQDGKKQGAASPANTEESMSKPNLVDQLKAVFSSAEAEGANASANAGGGTELVAGKVMRVAGIHYSTAGDKCASFEDGDKVTSDLNMATCNDCLRGEVARANAAKSNDASKADAAKIIETAADTFVATHCQNIGKDGSAALRSRFVAAKTAGDEDAAKDLETIAASFPKGQTARVDTSKGPNAEQAAGVPTSNEIHFAALDKLAAAGVATTDPNFALEYDKAVAAIKAGTGVASAAA